MRGTFEFLQISKVGKDKTIFGAQKKSPKISGVISSYFSYLSGF